MRKRLLAAILAASMLCFTVGCSGNTTLADGGQAVGVEDEISDGADANTDGGTGLENSDAGLDKTDEDTDSTGASGADVSGADVSGADGTDSSEEPEKDWYTLMCEASIQTTGNNYRLKKVIEKARSGEMVNMAALGGSITEGAGASSNSKGYAYQFSENFKKTYCSGENLNFVNAGLSGTPSSLGVMRYQRDVVDALGTCPDLLIIEFAVNDWEEATKGRALESLIYRALTDNEECAVILLFSVSEKKWNLQTEMSPYGKYYDLPMVSLLDALKSTTEVSDSKYFNDEYHPKTYGHTVMSDCLMCLLDTVDKAAADAPAEVPESAKKGRQFANMKMIYSDSKDVNLQLGAFSDTDSSVQSCYFFRSSSFPNNFMKSAAEGSPFRLTLKCQCLLLDFKTANDSSFGSADIYVDGELVKTVNGYSAGGWNNSNVVLIIDEKEVSEHTVEIVMSSGNEGKKFTILALAYN